MEGLRVKEKSKTAPRFLEKQVWVGVGEEFTVLVFVSLVEVK